MMSKTFNTKKTSVPAMRYGQVSSNYKNSKSSKESEYNATMPTKKALSGVGVRGPEISFTGLKKSKISGMKTSNKVRPFSGVKTNNLMKEPSKTIENTGTMS